MGDGDNSESGIRNSELTKESRVERFDRKPLFLGLSYGLLLLAVCVAQKVFFGMDRISGTLLFAIALFSAAVSALRWYAAFDAAHRGEELFSDRFPRLGDDPRVNSLVINVYKWGLILPLIGVMTL